MKTGKTNKKETRENQQSKRPLAKSDFEAVLKAATKPLKKEQDEKESEETSESRRPDDST